MVSDTNFRDGQIGIALSLHLRKSSQANQMLESWDTEISQLLARPCCSKPHRSLERNRNNSSSGDGLVFLQLFYFFFNIAVVQTFVSNPFTCRGKKVKKGLEYFIIRKPCVKFKISIAWPLYAQLKTHVSLFFLNVVLMCKFHTVAFAFHFVVQTD